MQIKFIVISLMYVVSFKDYPHVEVSRGHAVIKRKYCFYLDRFVLTCILYYLESNFSSLNKCLK